MALFGHRTLAALLQQVMGTVAPQALGQDNTDRFGQHQALGEVEVAAHARGIHLHALGDHLGLAQGAGDQATDLRQGFPLSVPQAQAALVLLGHGGEQRRDQPWHAGGGADQHRRPHRVALVRHGRGTTLAWRGRLEQLARLGLHQQADIAAELAQAAGDQAQRRRELHQAVTLGVPRLLGHGQFQLFGQRLGHRQGLAAQCRQAARGTAELQYQQARTQFLEALAMASQGAEHASQFHTQRHRCGVLQPGTPHQRRVGMLQCLTGQGVGQLGEVAFYQRQGIAQLQYQAAVHRILAGGAQVHVALGFRHAAGDHLAQRLDQRDRRVAGDGDGLRQGLHIVALGLAGRLDGHHRRVRHQPCGRLGTGQGGFEVEHALQPPAIGEDLAHGRRGEVGIEQLVAHAMSLMIMVQVRRLLRQAQAEQEGYRHHGGHVPVEGVLHAHGFQAQGHVLGRTAKHRVGHRVGQPDPRARTCGGNISAFTRPLMEV